MNISIIQPSRDNLKYLKWSYAAIRKNQGDHTVEICVADDASTDGTWDWCKEIEQSDPLFKCIRNNTGHRLGHTILYDRLVNEVATCEVAMIFHADMYLCPNALDAIEKHLYRKKRVAVGNSLDENGEHLRVDYGYELIPNKKTIVSLTRIEPPLHPPGKEKLLARFGQEPEEFNEAELHDMLYELAKGEGNNYDALIPKGYVSEGIFAPWAFFVEDFKEVGGHDELLAPQSFEDSDIFNRFQLNGVKFIQTWEGLVYHLTCRGSRFNPTLTEIGKNSSEWDTHNIKSRRNFIRKWGHFVKHDEYLKPIIPPKYDIGLVLENSNYGLIKVLEPWCSVLYVDCPDAIIKTYIEDEQPNTLFNLQDRIKKADDEKTNNIIIFLDGNKLSEKVFYYLSEISAIIESSGKIGEFELSNLRINIKSLETFEKKLIHI